jgi:uncharacterized protein YqgC (DUF456 family)
MPTWINLSVVGITIFAMLVGLFGLVVPLFPGIVVIWLAALGYGIVAGFHTVGIVLFIIITLFMLAGVTVDNVLMGVGARQGGASWLSLGAALVVGIAGTLLFPPVGGLIATPVAVLLIEFLRSRDWRKTWIAVRGLAVGWGLSFIVRFLIGVVMIVVWGIWVWLN